MSKITQKDIDEAWGKALVKGLKKVVDLKRKFKEQKDKK